MSLKNISNVIQLAGQAANIVNDVKNAVPDVPDQVDQNGNPKQEIVLSTRWLRKSELNELERWTSPSQNGKGLLKLNGAENLNAALSDFKNYEMILLDISDAANMKWLQYNIDYIRDNQDNFNVTLISSKWQSEMSFHDSLEEACGKLYRLREVPVRCKDKDTFYHMLHSTYINSVKPGCFHGLKSLVSFLLGRSA